MAKKRPAAGKDAGNPVRDGTEDVALDYRHHHARRPNNPTGGNAPEGKVEPTERKTYAYDPHRPPALRYDAIGRSDAITERMASLLAKAQAKPTAEGAGSLTAAEAAELADALRQGQPWLEWAGKREHPDFTVDAPAIHLHERISTRALLRIATRRDVQRSLFGEPELPYTQSVQFYHHAVNWANRLILGDNRAVMASLAQRENLAGKVQMIYVDPPYGIRFGSNFQSEVYKQKVGDKENDLTREMEVVKAYRDTWNLGIHSYLEFLSGCLTASKELLSDSGSIFVQIGSENIHLIKNILDQVFGNENFINMITLKKTNSSESKLLQSISDYIVWYAKDKEQLKYRPYYMPRARVDVDYDKYRKILQVDGSSRNLTSGERENPELIPPDQTPYRDDITLTSDGDRKEGQALFQVQGKSFSPGVGRHWRTTAPNRERLKLVNRVVAGSERPFYIAYWDDMGFQELNNIWNDLAGAQGKVYVVQTNQKAIQRCILMASDPGDLILDPTCGSGTTAVVAEQWGRRWITIDTSRVALAVARQRVMTAKFDYYRLRDELNGPTGGFYNKTVPHVTLKSIAQNSALDPIIARHEPILTERLAALNATLGQVTPELRARLELKLATKKKAKDKDDPARDADERRWQLPGERWEEWQVPFDTDPDWPKPLQDALIAYRKAWRSKRDEVNAAIAVNAEQEPLVDQPEVVKGIVRVSGPFTVEALQPAEESMEGSSPVDEPDEDLETFAPAEVRGPVTNAEAYREKMLRLLKGDGVRFPNNLQVRFDRLEPLEGSILSAAGEWRPEFGETESRRVAVAFGPQYGPITGPQVDLCLRAAHRALVYDDLVFAGFSFDSAAQTAIQDDPNPSLRCHLAFIRPDVNLDGLLKEMPNSQLFTVFGLPRASLQPCKNGTSGNGQYRVHMEGVDVYDPVRNEIISTGADKVAAWFVDTDYDGRTFCICQAFFPNRSAWDKLGKALKGLINDDALASFSGTESQPFDPPEGDEPRVAVKVIDPRGNEVLRILNVPRGA